GISLLEVKNSHLLSYMTEMAHLMLKIANGQSIQGDGSIERLVEIRTVLERIRPIEQKMKYQIDKLTKLAVSQGGEVDGNAARRPRPDNLMMDDMGEEGSSDEEADAEGQRGKGRKYVPPKLVAMRYDEDNNDREDRLVERAKRRALNSSLIEDLRQQYSQAPEEIREVVDERRRADDRHRASYEEEMMVRLQLDKKQKKAEKQRKATSTLDALLDFGDYMAVDGIDRDGQPLKKKSKISGGKTKFSGGKKGGKKMGKKKWKK
uniref:Neuroguidin n=1 Tax=Plectus sambesii TaxID=2011161 RepID=A0A914XNA9_9BILA